MGSIKVRNPLLSKKLKRTETRLLIIDDNQIRFNQICEQLTANEHRVQAYLLDDIKNFEKQLHLTWDLVIFGRAYDLKVDQALTLIRASQQPNLPLLLLKPDDYDATQYTSYVRKGIYDIINLDYPERFYFGLIRALSFSRLQQSQEQLMTELENAQSQAQALVEDSSKAVAIIQEGIHAQANAEYLQLFGLKSEDDLIGLPLLDLLQPQDITDFKFRFKKVSQGQFEHGRFDIHSQNPLLAKQNPLKIEFVGAADDAIQITIDIENTAQNTVPAQTTADKAAAKPSTYQLVNRTLAKQPSSANALVVFSLANCPESIFQADWQTTKNYFTNIQNFLKEQTNVPLFNVSNGLVVGLFQAESPAILESKLIGLNSLTKPQLLTVDQHTYPLNLRIGYVPFTPDIQNESSFEQLISQGFANALPQPQEQHNSGLTLDLSFGESNLNVIESAAAVPQSYSESAIIAAIRQSLDRGEIHLKYQQLYDKQDTNLYTYEVTSGFIFNSEWKSLTGLIDLAEDPELSIKLDRWILVEACKQLHNFITQYPEAKLIINLNKFVLLQDRSFPEFVSKLITIIGSRLSHPLILQFSEEDISQNLGDAQKQISLLRQHGAEISLRDFGHSIYSESILKQVDIHYLTLHSALTEKLAADDSTQELQEQLSIYSEIKPVEVLLRDLNDMNLFANAWNVDARFIQGDYFQKKLDHLIDVQDQ
ncbi:MULTISPECIES: EAL domain-containing protein [Acinetobacter]|uniref:EAL domain-containing protein n=1 Tax=Acinetobacter TaxID=469 RepID=UPI0015B5B2E5|nr:MULTISPECIES: EAL domain-containing protein [Acinetobacter]MBT0886245.1 EAL domain-containing protein [Acinetobacter towneri]MDM1721252.1 EAL domain-containing protein [Acinetobacter towneri]MDV2454005.1 EAL domain-containing protein [Acinetobacter towneri]NWJ91652.1 EAL domain-containing protein [Acinetobacter sp. Swhac1]WOE27845.1 EAL domain-containing protein [Acinetobacter towneri]